jgi:hypothetical protein
MRNIGMALFMICVGAAGCSSGVVGGGSGDLGQNQEPQKIARCGGFAGTPCAEGFTCVDDPNDSCDPNHGGADCGGICVEDPHQMCGGFAGLQCPSGQTCVDDPGDDCNPTKGGADCSGICVDAAPQQCGGFAGLQCPSGQTCVDDPSDDCDPQHGGADCGGICVTP